MTKLMNYICQNMINMFSSFVSRDPKRIPLLPGNETQTLSETNVYCILEGIQCQSILG